MQTTIETSRRRWYAIGAFFDPYVIPETGAAGCQRLCAIDLESNHVLGTLAVARPPAAFTAAELWEFFGNASTRRGRPTEGLLVSESVWRGSHALMDDPSLRPRMLAAWRAGLRWPEMDGAERSKLEWHLQTLGLGLAWLEQDLPEDLLLPTGS